jgi:hypothetical protein
MKKVFFVSALVILSFAGRTFAQSTTTGSLGGIVTNPATANKRDTTKPSGEGHKDWIQIESYQFGSSIPEGLQSITMPRDGGTLQFKKTGSRITDVKYTEKTTTRVRLFTSVQYPYKLTPPATPIEGGYFLASDNKNSICFSMVNNTYRVFLHRAAD